jgi:DNA-binding CsgD family transcriptional regulator
MDGRRFDRWAQTLARRLNQDTSAELGGSAGRLDQPVPDVPAAPAVGSGTCAQPALAAAAHDRDGQSAATSGPICGWELPPVVPATNDDPPRGRTSRSGRRSRTQLPSSREQEIAALIARGLKDREIAAALVLSEHTVHAHVRNLLDKLGLTSRTQIAAWVATRAPDAPSTMSRDAEA